MNVAAPVPPPKRRPASPSAAERSSDLERRRELGQFFTPAVVAGFAWDFLETMHHGKFPANTRIIDPACGDGVFLRVAHERGQLPARCLFGADIDETLEPDWRRDPLLEGASVHLANGLVDAPAMGLVEGTFDIVAGNPPFSGRGLGELLRLLEDSADAERHHEQDLFGAPSRKVEPMPARKPLTRQERAGLDLQARSLSQYACWRPNAAPGEGEEPESEPDTASTDFFAGLALHDRPRPTASDCERTALLIRQWPADRLLDVSRPEIRDAIQRLASTAIEVFFTERFLRLAKRGGLIAVIVPDSIVASERLRPLRRWLSAHADLRAVVSLPQKVFTGVGANAKTTIIFLRRLAEDRPEEWWMKPDDFPGAKQTVLLTAPRIDAPNYSLEVYLNSVLASARRPNGPDSDMETDDE